MNTKVYERSFCLLIALATTSCGTMLVPEELAPRSADSVATRVGLFTIRRGFCDVSRLDQIIPSSDGLARPEGGEVIAGFNNELMRGADPFPCNRQFSQEYTGAVHFDLSDVRGTVIDSATLRLERRNTRIPWRPESASSLCMVAVAQATEDWEAGYLSGPGGLTIGAVPFRRFIRSNRIMGGFAFDPGIRVISFTSPEITRIVQTWANGRPNFGFMIHQEREFGDYVGANDLSCTSYFVATLQMSIRRFVPIVPVEPIGP